MSTTLKNICQLTNSIFSKRNQLNQKDLQLNETMAMLMKLFNQLKLNDLNLEPSDFVDNSRRMFRSYPFIPAPLSFVKVFENDTFSMTLFGFRGERSQIPLHDHPSMFAFARCLHGSLAVQSYTVLPETIPIPMEIIKKLPSKDHSNLVAAMLEDEEIMDSEHSRVLTLTPTEKNIHQVRSISNQLSIMVDIISPPYMESTDTYYYNVIDTVYDSKTNRSITWLCKTKDAGNYYCDTIPYSNITLTQSDQL